ncbi:MAG: protein-glutamate O-methyltransferase CheR [Candidatus Methanomethylicaceae archaeon]
MYVKRSKDFQKSIREEEFELFREFFYRKTGIMFDRTKRYFVDRRILQRMEASGHETVKSYLSALRSPSNIRELQELINSLTVNETYFFREKYQMECLVSHLLPEVTSRKKKGEVIRIWSIPSSTGEEPYSIAIYLLEFWADLDSYEVEIMASDIDTGVLELAKKATYGLRAVQQLPSYILQKYFDCNEDGFYRLCEEVRSAVEFSRVNIIDHNEIKRYRGMDVVFCRNLLIYFDDASRKLAAENLYEVISPGGFICLGHSESMSRISPLFLIRKYPQGIVYQKPLEGGK